MGTVIPASTYSSLGDSDKANVTTLTFTDEQKNNKYYYCRESYKVGENTEGETVTGVDVTGGESGTYTNEQTVPVGLVITESNFNSLKNYQKDFTIHGIAPTETSTLYVSRFSDIFDLSKEKIITVIYEYNYEETNTSGTNVTPVSERHVVNIHVLFKSGIPFVEDIKAPQIVLPGTFVGVREPHVTPGAYEVTGGGWKLFEKQADAESHINGIEYTPTSDPLYWYQDGYYLAYYAKTYLGETYSNTVQVSVANYHDLKKVLDDTNHYYVDNPTVHRNSKIYINDATNGATQLKQFFDLSKSTLDEHVLNCQNLEFILHTNVNHTGTWTPIGEEGHCFSGNFHGDGYHIDGLDHSLFGKLCGNVYNLGVTGSFTSAGVADTGDGYVENCWVMSSAETVDNTKLAVLGHPSDESDDDGKQIVNCYYLDKNHYKETEVYPSHPRGVARKMTAREFYNGTVAYNLNGFYLNKRYYDGTNLGEGKLYQYFVPNADGTLPTVTTEAYYPSGYAIYPLEKPTEGKLLGYVEDRFGDGDFRYADGVIPESENQRTLVDADGNSHFYPIWPDDYLYFGQMLTYNWNNQRPHENVPSHIVKSSGRLSNTDESNRVYRAPAYYQSEVMDVAHFNPAVNLVAYSKPKNANDTDLTPAYPNMTAIDFAGHNDTEYKQGLNGNFFYQPLLDDDGLQSITNRDETNNLLVYAPSADANAQTNGVLTGYFTDPSYADSYDMNDPYRRVNISAGASSVHGHLVQSDLTAASDHLLIDKQDFNCPIGYTFADDKRMWYQRNPDLYVDKNEGWEIVSLPFTAELVTTQDKGEITHFYSGSRNVDENGTKIGHEYWLREYIGKIEETEEVYKAAFNYPDAAGDTKDVGNTFLWDYYYSKNGVLDNAGPDKNSDIYQTYYNSSREYAAYPLLAAAEPYIIGFPGKTYYEFDLSGEFVAQNTAATAPAKLGKQTISFVSETGITIDVSDSELNAVTKDGYSFLPNYMSKKVDGYLMNVEGSSFDVTPEGGLATVPFRPYFVKANTNGARGAGQKAVKHIIFDGDDSSFVIDEDDPSKEEIATENMIFTTRRHEIIVTSNLRVEADVRIYNISGITVASFTILPGETISTYIPVSGVYIVRAADGRYQKKLAVK